MRISHHQRKMDATVDVYPMRDVGGPTTYFLKARIGRGTGSETEPCVYVGFSSEELFTFAEDALGLIAAERTP